jgi:hypothetical protein
VEEKVALVEEHRGTHGLNRCLKALSLSKGTYHYRRKVRPRRLAKEEALKERIVSVIEENPGYGYRRIIEELIKALGTEPINHKRLRRLLKSFALGLRRYLPRSKPSPIAPSSGKSRWRIGRLTQGSLLWGFGSFLDGLQGDPLRRGTKEGASNGSLGPEEPVGGGLLGGNHPQPLSRPRSSRRSAEGDGPARSALSRGW